MAAGPIGRTAEAGASASIGSVAAIYSYSKTKGLFAGQFVFSLFFSLLFLTCFSAKKDSQSKRLDFVGVSIEGSIIVERKDANEAFYRHPVTASELLSGAIPPPPQADILYRALNAKASGFGAQGSYLHSRSRDSDQYSPMGSPHLDRSASTAGSYQNPNFQSTALNRSATSATARNFDNDPAPRYTPPASAYVPDQKLQSRPSSDSNSPFHSSPGHQNQPMANLSGPRIPPKIGAKPDTVTAMYDFAGEEATDLSFKKGDIITVTKKTPSKNDWWTGRCQGREGSFPANYVE